MNTDSSEKIIILVGPTASGKSARAIELAKQFHGEVVSADSRQVYRGLDLGTGKVTPEETRGVRHHLLDVASPHEVFSAHQYVQAARHAIADICARGKLPIVTGGTGFYIDALVGRITLPDVPADPILREELRKLTAPQLYHMLETADPARAKTIDQHNPVRLIRALEIARTHEAAAPKAPPHYDLLWLGITTPLPELEQKIATRIRARIDLGMIDEASRLYAEGLSYERMDALGLEYRYLARLLQHEMTQEQFEQELAIAIRQYAKRQITYWKRNHEIHWHAPAEASIMQDEVSDWLARG